MDFFGFILAIALSILAAIRPLTAIPVVICLLPWGALELNFGASVLPAELIAIVGTTSALVKRDFKLVLPTWARYIACFLLLSTLIGLFNLVDAMPFQTKSGSPAQNGIGRLAVQLFKWTFWVLFACNIWMWRKEINPVRIFRLYIASVALLSILGVAQFMIFTATGYDLFPLQALDGGSAFIGSNMRVTSFAGEPKRFATSLVIALIVLWTLWPILKIRRMTRIGLVTLFTSCLLLTGSSSGFFTFFAAGSIVMLMRLLPAPLSGQASQTAGFISFVSVAAFYFFLSMNFDPESLADNRPINGILDMVRYQTIERIQLDDTDAVYLSYFWDNLDRLALGMGLGLGHMEAMGHIPPHQRWYMDGSTMPPKSGVVESLVDAGLIGMMLFATGVSHLVSAGSSTAGLTIHHRKRIQAMGLALVVVLALRTYDLFLILCILSLALTIRPACESQKTTS